MGKKTISVNLKQELLWPPRCALCLAEAVVESAQVSSGKILSIPYCQECNERVKRLVNLEGSLAMISLVGAVVLFLAALIYGAIRDIQNILQSSTCAAVLIGGPMLMGIIYILGQLVLLPYKAAARHKLAKPGVKVKKGSSLSVMNLVFANSQYADLFCDANNIPR